MAITRQDLITKLGVYSLHSMDGEWAVFSYVDCPSITMRRLSDGVQKVIKMESIDNLKSRRIAQLDREPVFPDSESVTVREPTKQELFNSANEVLVAMLSDGLQIMAMITDGKKISAENKKIVESWQNQVSDFIKE